ncbi:MAG: HD domain-containing protein [Candidatus Brocadiia bacterium]
MDESLYGTPEYYHGVNLIADPVHRYIPITYPMEGISEKTTERDVIDSSWVQRLRRIHQLQSAWWVFPGAEHSRFVHSLGVMHCATLFVKHLYRSLQISLQAQGEECPSAPCVEETMRIAGLCHDLGHGPFGHFFDEQCLQRYGITHEDLSQKIIVEELGDLITGLCRSPSGSFAPGESVVPEYVAFLIKKPTENADTEHMVPLWVRWLQPLFSGIFTVDNIDYTLRDAYMCGISPRLIDLERLLFYSFFTENGLTFHYSGLSSLEMFLKSRWYLYQNVYYHRTVRGIDLQLADIFDKTISHMMTRDPRENLDEYSRLTDYSVFETVARWTDDPDAEKRNLSTLWAAVLRRDVAWKRVFEQELSYKDIDAGLRFVKPEEVEDTIRRLLPSEASSWRFKVDMPIHDPKPVNPYIIQKERLKVYNPSTRIVEEKSVRDIFPHLPGSVAILRVYTKGGEHAREMNEGARRALASFNQGYSTNV